MAKAKIANLTWGEARSKGYSKGQWARARSISKGMSQYWTVQHRRSLPGPSEQTFLVTIRCDYDADAYPHRKGHDDLFVEGQLVVRARNKAEAFQKAHEAMSGWFGRDPESFISPDNFVWDAEPTSRASGVLKWKHRTTARWRQTTMQEVG